MYIYPIEDINNQGKIMDKKKLEQMIEKHEKENRKTQIQMILSFSIIWIFYVVFMIEWYNFTH